MSEPGKVRRLLRTSGISGAARFLRLSFALLTLALAAYPSHAHAAETDRVAIERLSSESPLEAAFAYVDACYRVGVAPTEVHPLQLFEHSGVQYVRLAVAGPPLAMRCLNGLEGRRGVDGTIRWFDGFGGGQLVPQGPSAERIADSEWYSPGATLPSQAPNEPLVDGLAHGSAEARTTLAHLPLDESLADLGALMKRGGPGGLAALEIIARADPRWQVRAAAVGAIDPVLSATTIMEAARKDPSWEVRMNGVGKLAAIANDVASTRRLEAMPLLASIARDDADWTVQRQALWVMSSATARASADTLREILSRPGVDRRVVATALEILGDLHQLRRDQVAHFLQNPAPEPRAIAAELLISQMTAGDAPVLWRALQDPARMVRLASASFLYRIDDDTIGPDLWKLYVSEASEVDADQQFEQSILDFVARNPTLGMPVRIRQRLEQADISPDERRLLSRTLSRIEPESARALFEPQLSSTDPHVRSIAADAAPDVPPIHALRLKLLKDPDSDVRAGALLGFCRSSPTGLGALVSEAELDPTPLGQEAVVTAAHCGQKMPEVKRLRTSLLGPPIADLQGSPERARVPATAAILLLLLAVTLEKTRKT